MKFDAVIFDIDNVLVDTRASYTDCIRKTVETYLAAVLGFQPSRTPLLTRQDVEEFKSLGGFNDDWDTCYGLLLYFLSLKPARHRLSELRKLKNIPELVQTTRSTPLGGHPPFYPPPAERGEEKGGGPRQGRKKERGAVSMEKIADMFQRFYLGEFVWNEKLLIPSSFLKRLRRIGLRLGVLTGRNGEEARFALRRFQIDSLFDAVLTQDDTPKTKKKPNPYGLLKIAALLGKDLRYLYVGDLPDDMIAAQRAKKKMKIGSCGFLVASASPSEMKRRLKNAGANFFSSTSRELMEIILPKSHSV